MQAPISHIPIDAHTITSHILCIALSYDDLNKSKIKKVTYLLYFFDKTRALVLFLELNFDTYFE